MQTLQPMNDVPPAHQPPKLSRREQAERNRAQAVHMEVAKLHGWPRNRAERRRHEKRVLTILQKLPPLVDEAEGR